MRRLRKRADDWTPWRHIAAWRWLRQIAAGFKSFWVVLAKDRAFLAFLTWLAATAVASFVWDWSTRTQLEVQGGAFLLYLGWQAGGMRGYSDGLREGGEIAMSVVKNQFEQFQAGVERRN